MSYFENLFLNEALKMSNGFIFKSRKPKNFWPVYTLFLSLSDLPAFPELIPSLGSSQGPLTDGRTKVSRTALRARSAAY